MKNFLAIISITAFLFSCNKSDHKDTAETKSKDSITAVKKFVVDSVKVEDSLVINKNLTTAFNRQLLVFPSIENKAILDSIYKEALVETRAYDKNSLQADLTKQMQKSFDKTKEDSKEWSPEFKQTWEDTSAMKVLSHKNNVLTLLYTGSGYTGGAHGYYFESYKVFDLDKNVVVNQDDILNNAKDPAWDKILKNHLDDPEQKEMLLVDKIAPNNNFYFDDKKITFVYNQYEITAYAAGVIYITVNFSEIKNLIKPEFLKQYKIK